MNILAKPLQTDYLSFSLTELRATILCLNNVVNQYDLLKTTTPITAITRMKVINKDKPVHHQGFDKVSKYHH